jgi:DNA invertase Pin-like site-specific DNA recombinase
MGTVLASMAQWERRIISTRTKDALAQKRAAGVVLGRRSALPEDVVERIRRERASGRTLSAIGESLNDAAIPTGQGGARWRPSSVAAVLASSRRNGTS